MTFGILFLIVAAGLLGPVLSGSRRFALPMVAGQILAGVIIGNSGLRLLDVNDPTLTFFANLGLGMLLFVVGTRLPVDQFKENLPFAKKGIIAAIVTFAAAIPLAFGLSHFTPIHHMSMLVLLLAASSTSTVMPILAERHVTSNDIKALMMWIPIADVATIMLLPLAMGEGSMLRIVVGCGAITLAAAAAYFGLRIFRSSPHGEHYRQLSKQRGWALDLRLQLLILFALAWLAGIFGTSVLVAGFAAGITSTFIGQPRRFEKQLNGLAEGLFVPLFFVVVGARIDFRELFNVPSNLLLMAAIAGCGLIAHLIASKVVKLPASAGLVASQTMGLPAAIVAMALTDHLLTPGQSAAVISAALITLGACAFGAAKLAAKGVPTNTEKHSGGENEQEE